jgi:sarcosine oxidase
LAQQVFDVIVLGLGGMGSAAACHLARRGERVLGIEQHSPAHDKGSSHGASRIIRQAYYEDPAYVPLVQRAYELWEQLQQDSQTELLRITGGLMIGHVDSPVVRGTLASANEHSLPHETLDARELKRRYPVLNPRASDVAIYETRAGFLRPELCVQAHLQQAERAGAELHFGEQVTKWHAAASGGVTITTAYSEYQGDRLVIALGAWAPKALTELGRIFEVRRHVMCWFNPRGGTEPFLPDRFPVYLWEIERDNIFYGFPAADGPEGGAKVAIHTGGDICTAESIVRDISERDIQELRTPLATYIPALNGPVLRAVVCMYTLTPDEHFVVAPHPNHPQVTIAAGFSGHGFKFTSVMGEILADLAISGITSHPIGLFSPARFSARPELTSVRD